MVVTIKTTSAPPPAGKYSQGAIANGLLFTAGQGPFTPSGELVGQDIRDQTVQVMTNLLEILKQHGLESSDIVKVTAHLQDLKRDFAGFDAAYGEFFAEDPPCRTTVGSNLMDILVEIDVVAALR